MSLSRKPAQAASGAENSRLKQLGAPSLNDGPRTSCRPECNFITFKGQNKERESKQEKSQSECGSGIFNIVPLDNENLQAEKNLSPIGPSAMNNGLRESSGDAQPKEPFKFAGYLSTILASLSNSISLLLVKLLPVDDNLQEKAKTVAFRGLLMMLFCGISIVQQGYSFKVEKGEYMVNFSRAFFGSANVVLSFVSLMYITLGETQTIVNSACVWTCLLSFVVLREPLPISLIVAVPMSFLGIILLAQPDLILDMSSEFPVHHLESNKSYQVVPSMTNATAPMEDDVDNEFFLNRWPGFATSIAASLTWSLVTIILKFRKKTPIVTSTFYHGFAQVVLGLGIQFAIGFASLPSTLLEWSLHLGVGVLSFLTQNLFQWALLFVPAGTYGVTRTLDIPFCFILGAIFLNELVRWTSVVGSILIMAVVAMLVLNDQLVRGLRSFC